MLEYNLMILYYYTTILFNFETSLFENKCNYNKIIKNYLSSTVFSEKHDTRSHNDEIYAIDFSTGVLLINSVNFKNSNTVKLSCMAVGTDPSTLEPSINQLNKCFNVFLPSIIHK